MDTVYFFSYLIYFCVFIFDSSKREILCSFFKLKIKIFIYLFVFLRFLISWAIMKKCLRSVWLTTQNSKTTRLIIKKKKNCEDNFLEKQKVFHFLLLVSRIFYLLKTTAAEVECRFLAEYCFPVSRHGTQLIREKVGTQLIREKLGTQLSRKKLNSYGTFFGFFFGPKSYVAKISPRISEMLHKNNTSVITLDWMKR